jgi:hypothetical protein
MDSTEYTEQIMTKLSMTENQTPRPREIALGSPRYGRWQDVERLFSIKRSTTFALLKTGKIRGCALSLTGKRSRTRLIDLASVESFVKEQVETQGKGGRNEK